MSGGFHIGRFGRKSPKLPSRPDISNPAPEKEPVGGGPEELPSRIYIEATIRTRKLAPLARVKRRGLFFKGQAPTLWLEISNYIKSTPWVNLYGTPSIRQKQALQTVLHELMHIALWDDTSIAHSKDKDSLLYFKIKGDILEPSEWDLEQMKAAAERIGRIDIILREQDQYNKVYLFVYEALHLWNRWIGRDFFKLITPNRGE